MNPRKFIFWLLTLCHFGAAAMSFPIEKLLENTNFLEAQEFSDKHLPIANTDDYHKVGQFNSLHEFELETNNESHHWKFYFKNTQINPLPERRPISKWIIPSLDRLTIIFPFHSFP